MHAQCVLGLDYDLAFLFSKLNKMWPSLVLFHNKTPRSQLNITGLCAASFVLGCSSENVHDERDGGKTAMAYVTCDISPLALNHNISPICNAAYLCKVLTVAVGTFTSVHHVRYPSASVGARNIHQRQQWIQCQCHFKLLETCPGSIYIRI